MRNNKAAGAALNNTGGCITFLTLLPYKQQARSDACGAMYQTKVWLLEEHL